MLPRLAADAVVLLHLAFILFAVCGAVLVLRWPRVALVHLPCVAWAVYVELGGKICPLTPLEIALRQQSGARGYSGGFIDHYLLPLIYPSGLTPATQYVLAGIVAGLNLLLYGWLLWRRR